MTTRIQHFISPARSAPAQAPATIHTILNRLVASLLVTMAHTILRSRGGLFAAPRQPRARKLAGGLAKA